MDLRQLIDQLDADLISRHRFDTELFEGLTCEQRSSGLLHGDRPICPFLRPYFLDRSRYEEICRAANYISSAVEKLTRAALENREIISELGLTEKEDRWSRLDPGYRCISVNSRLDTFLSPTGFAFLEYNGENPAGIGDQSALENLFRSVPEVRSFLAEHSHFFPQPQRQLLRALDETYREFGGRQAKPSIAVVDWEGVSTCSEFYILKEFFESEGYLCRICDPAELEFDGKVLRHDDFEIDIFFKRVIIHEFLDRFDESHPLYTAIGSGAVCMVNSFRSKIPHKKSSFAILSDEKYHRLFNDREREVIQRHIPWTRRMRQGITEIRDKKIDLIEYVRRERHRYVLKPNDDYGGKGISIGWEATDSEWDNAIENALRTHYVVQERVVVERTEIPVFSDGEVRRESLLVDFDPFLFRGVVEGGLVRLSSQSLVNVTQGGGETALAVMEGF
jgi:hypothetical protein